MTTISVIKPNVEKAKMFLQSKLSSVLEKIVFEELLVVLEELKSNKSQQYLATAFSKAIRLFGKGSLTYTSMELKSADEICSRWIPPSSIDKAVRILILLEIPEDDENNFVKTIEDLFATADVGEQVVLYSAFPLFAYPEKLIPRCLEGIRSNMGEVFEAVANENSFPSDYLSEEAFNQMVLKCLFVGKPLYKITNLFHRLNKNLARMASDYAHERWAAGRELNPELWQLLADFMEVADMKDMYRLSNSENEFEKQAAALCCKRSMITDAEEIYAASNYHLQVESGELNWYILGVNVWKK